MAWSIVSHLPILWLTASSAVHATSLGGRGAGYYSQMTTCRSIPGDSGWPKRESWDSLNATVSGRLLETVPLAHVCHAPTYDGEACDNLASQWGRASLVTTSPAEIIAPWFENQTCVPFTDPKTPCDLGGLASYSINVSSAGDIQAALAFAKKENIRLVIKNSGHDLLGKSTGKGALSLWTHNLDGTKLIPSYNSSYYNGPAMKIGAGVTGGAASEFASRHGYRMVIGSCPTVGAAGGYTQGGGHSLLTGAYGYSADNVLEWEVITAGGKHIVATPTNNQDLYWALSGGGGGTYAVVLSMTSRVFAEGPIAIAEMSFTVTDAGSEDAYWDAVGSFLDGLYPLLDEAGVVGEFFLRNDTLQVFALMGPHHNTEQLTNLLSPLVSAVSDSFETHSDTTAAQNVNLQVSSGSSYSDLYVDRVQPILVNVTESVATGGRYVSRDNWMTNKSAVVSALRHATKGGRFSIAVTAFNKAGTSRQAAPPIASNSVPPQANNAFLSLIIRAAWNNTQPWSEAATLQNILQHEVMPVIYDATPNAGAYMNEANWDQNDWQNTFYGTNYHRLKEIKHYYDPDHLFYAVTAVGSEAWSQDTDGRLCRTGF